MPAEPSVTSNGVVSPGENGSSERDVREAAMEGVLVVACELGYRETSVRSIREHSGGHRAQFDRHFESKEDCSAQAYATWIERLCVSLLEGAVTAPGWEAGVHEAIGRLFRFVTERPGIARAPSPAGGPRPAAPPSGGGRRAAGRRLPRHGAVGERLAAAIDGARAEID